MPYYKFGQNDIFNNNIETHPKCEFLIHDRKIYYNGYVSEPSSHSSESGEDNPNVKHIPSGYVSLYEINIDRQASLHGGTVSPIMAYQFMTKDGSLDSFKTVSTSDFSSTMYGDVLTGSYPISASLSIERYVADTDPQWTDCGKTRPRMNALKNTLNHYKYLSTYYDFSYYDDSKEVTLVSIPSIFYGSSIEKGSVSLKYYITGSLAGELQDIKRNGELVQVSGIEVDNGKVAGVVLYNEGFIALTGDWELDPLTLERYNWCPEATTVAGQCDQPKWKYWGQLGDPDETDITPGVPDTPLDYPIFHFDDGAALTNSGTPANSTYPAIFVLTHDGYVGHCVDGGSLTNDPDQSTCEGNNNTWVAATTSNGAYDADFPTPSPYPSSSSAFSTAMEFNKNNKNILLAGGNDVAKGTLLTLEVDHVDAEAMDYARASIMFDNQAHVFVDGDKFSLIINPDITAPENEVWFEFTTDNDVIDGSTIGYNTGTTNDPTNTSINIGIANASTDNINDMLDDDIVPAVNAADIGITAYRPEDKRLDFAQSGPPDNSADNETPYTYILAHGFGAGPHALDTNSHDFGDSGTAQFPACGDSDICFNGDFTFDFWIKLDSQTRTSMFGTNLSQCIYEGIPGDGNLTYLENLISMLGNFGMSGVTEDYGFIFSTESVGDSGLGANFIIVPLPASLQTSGLGTDWHHIGIVRSSSHTLANSIKIYVDGGECVDGSGDYIAGSPYAEDKDLFLHGVYFGGGSFISVPFTGLLDEVRLIKGTAIDFSNVGTPTAPATGGAGGGIDTGRCVSSNVPNSSFDLSFNGTNYIPTVTMLAHAKKGELNHSNNQTFLTYGQSNAIISSTGSLYAENSELAIKNTVKSPYDGYEATFQKQTWISQIGIYDEDRNLIAIAKLANPVRKTEDREFTFKLKLDI